MRNCISITLILLVLSTQLSGQQMLHESFKSIVSESVKYNEEVAALYYKEIPIALVVAKKSSLFDRAKYYMFHNSICISETSYFPRDTYPVLFTTFKAKYSNHEVTGSGDVWTQGDLRIGLNVTYSKPHRKEVCMATYSYLGDKDKGTDTSEKMQTPYISRKVFRTNSQE